ncbi:MAG: hypothetical protein H7239_13250 [Flavobacterium sp.]|nr:hypothetical protein [Flavobacterium sp.]
MNLNRVLIIGFVLFLQQIYGQENQDSAILKVLLSKYYQNEKVIKKDRLQLLRFYCKKAPNNEETFEVINKSSLLKQNSKVIKSQVINTLNEDWSKELSAIFAKENQYLKSKVNDCLSLEAYQKVSDRFNDHNQRLMIVSKPMYFASKYCLVKVAFYRNIEHNNGCFIVLENKENVWTIVDLLNEWST